MCDHSPDREAAMTVIREPGPDRRGGIWCDPCIEPVVRALNTNGLATTASCCGHGNLGWVMLADGRVAMIAPDLEAAHRIERRWRDE